jgi:hypothetical protein
LHLAAMAFPGMAGISPEPIVAASKAIAGRRSGTRQQTPRHRTGRDGRGFSGAVGRAWAVQTTVLTFDFNTR